MLRRSTRALQTFLVGLLSLFTTTAVVHANGHEGHANYENSGANAHGDYRLGQAKRNQFWWPQQLDLSLLRDHDAQSNPLGADFDYAAAFNELDLAAVKADIMPRSPTRKIGGLQTLVTTGHSSFASRGIAPAPIARWMVGAVQTAVRCASIR